MKLISLPAQDKNVYIVWPHAAGFHGLEALETLWSSSKEVKIKLDGLLVAEIATGLTALHMAAQKYYRNCGSDLKNAKCLQMN
jgi:hypothetical protein